MTIMMKTTITLTLSLTLSLMLLTGCGTDSKTLSRSTAASLMDKNFATSYDKQFSFPDTCVLRKVDKVESIQDLPAFNAASAQLVYRIEKAPNANAPECNQPDPRIGKHVSTTATFRHTDNGWALGRISPGAER